MVPMAPSAVCVNEMPSLALRPAWLRPLTLAVMREAIAKPAAASLALLMRRPVERRSRATDNPYCDVDRARCELSELTLVLITEDIFNS